MTATISENGYGASETAGSTDATPSRSARIRSVLVAVIALALAEPHMAPAAQTVSPIAEALLENEPWIGDFDEMAERRQIRALVVYSKTFYFLDRGRQRGISHDLLKEFETFVNDRLQTGTLKIHVVFIPVRRDQLLSGLVEGRGDIAAANLTITPERLELVDFSDPLLTGVREQLLTGPSAPPVTDLGDLAGREIHVRRSSSYYDNLVSLSASLESTGRQPLRLIGADEALEDEDLLEMVNAGLVPMIVVDSHKAGFWTQIFDEVDVHPDIAIGTGGEIAWAFRKDSPQLEPIINEFVKGHKKGTLLGNILLKRYLKSTKYVRNSLSAEELQKFQRMVEFFRRYAGQYDFDYLMLAAQAYQESGLIQSTKSSAGAIGVMQLLPSTAADRNVDIPGIEKLENNIHAGTKYLRFIVDRYYDDDAVDDLNRMLFGFAAYNAGPARVNGLRKKTAAMGLNPDVWFGNVEIAASEVIGRETVQYVSNIYKYYIAYRMVAEQIARKQAQSGGDTE